MPNPERIFNFSSGPAMLPDAVLDEARSEMMSYRGSGMSIMELSHRSDLFGQVLTEAKSGLKMALGLGDEFEVLFLQGGATAMFSLIPMNYLDRSAAADLIITGAWGAKAAKAAQFYGGVSRIFDSADTGYRSVPDEADLRFSPDAAYVHYTSNETIEGVEFPVDLTADDKTVVCDASSNILSRPIDTSKYSIIYAGAQKNIGPSGVTVVVVRRSLLETQKRDLPAIFDLAEYARHDSMINTPNTWGIYLISLVCKWLRANGGVNAMAENADTRSRLVYDAIDRSGGLFIGHADAAARSRMNITFTIKDERLDREFVDATVAANMDGIRGHRSVGGYRASMYNAFPIAGARRLAELIDEFTRKYA